jgi:hypothetical protein
MSIDKIMLSTADTVQLHSYKYQHIHYRYNNIKDGISYHMLHQKKQQNIIILQTRTTWLTLQLQISISTPTNLDYQDFLGPDNSKGLCHNVCCKEQVMSGQTT